MKEKETKAIKIPSAGLAIVISIKNTLDVPAEDVKLLNYEFDKHSDIRYSNIYGDYRIILNQMIRQDFKVGTIRMVMKNYQGKEGAVHSALVAEEENGRKVTMPVTITYDPHQQQSSIIEKKIVFTLAHNRNLVIKSIPENATLFIYLFPATDEKAK